MSQLPCLKCFLSASEGRHRGAGDCCPRDHHTCLSWDQTWLLQLAPILPPVGLKYFGKVLGQEESMKYKENLNSRFLMQNIYRLYQK